MSKPKRKRLKPWQRGRLKMLVVVVIGCSVLGILPAKRMLLTKDVRHHIFVIKSAGNPTTLEEFEAWKEPVPDDANAAPIYLQAITAYNEAFINTPYDMTDKIPFYGGERVGGTAEFDDTTWTTISNFLDLNEKTISLLHEGMAYTECRYPLDNVEMWNKGLEQLHDLTKLLCLEAMLAVHNKDTAKTEKAYITALAATLSIQSQCNSESYSIRGECIQTILQSLSWSITRCEFEDEFLQRIDAALSKQDDLEFVQQALIGDSVYSLEMMNSAIENSRNEDSFSRGLEGILGNLDQLFRTVLRGQSKIMKISLLPRHEGLIAVDKLQQEMREDFMYQIVSTAWIPSLEPFAAVESRVQLGKSLVAIERYCQVHKQIPADLGDLVPEYLNAIPIDPFDGQPLRYEVEGEGYKIFSVNRNRIDDQGHETKDITLKVGSQSS